MVGETALNDWESIALRRNAVLSNIVTRGNFDDVIDGVRVRDWVCDAVLVPVPLAVPVWLAVVDSLGVRLGACVDVCDTLAVGDWVGDSEGNCKMLSDWLDDCVSDSDPDDDGVPDEDGDAVFDAEDDNEADPEDEGEPDEDGDSTYDKVLGDCVWDGDAALDAHFEGPTQKSTRIAANEQRILKKPSHTETARKVINIQGVNSYGRPSRVTWC